MKSMSVYINKMEVYFMIRCFIICGIFPKKHNTMTISMGDSFILAGENFPFKFDIQADFEYFLVA